MIKSVFAQKDATIYKDILSLNTGLDEILEIRKSSLYKINIGTIAETAISTTASPSLARTLIKFDLSEISSSIQSGKITSPKYYLKLYTSDAKQIQTDYTIEAMPISQSWDMGSGKKASNPIISNGATWNYKNYTISASISTGNVWSGSTAIPIGGGTWHTQSKYIASQVFSYETTDLEMDVSNIVNAWMTGGLANEGFILAFSSSLESNSTEYGSINFFSRDTNTIYPPTLQVKWNDSVYSTGSLSAVDINGMAVSLSGLKERYKNSEIAKLNLFIRDKFPAKAYVTSSRYLVGKYLPSSSYYSVKDAHTEEILIPFDSGSTKISSNSTGSYFNFDMTGLQPERYYKFILKVENSDNTIIIDDKFYFRVER